VDENAVRGGIGIFVKKGIKSVRVAQAGTPGSLDFDGHQQALPIDEASSRLR
jgi:hypothetical protein